MPHLDGLRCFAVLIVVVSHTFAVGRDTFGVAGVGPFGVRLFFVLSGFLITGILLRARDDPNYRYRAAVRTFYARRFLRIFPLYYLVLALGVGLAIGHSYRADLVWHLAYLSNWRPAMGTSGDPAGALWSLGVEEQFYLVWPTLIFLTPRRHVGMVLAGAALIAPVFRSAWVLESPHSSPLAIMWATPSDLDALGLGALLAWGRSRHPDATATRVPWAAIVGSVLLATIALMGLSPRTAHNGSLIQLDPLAGELLSVWLVNAAADGFRPATLGARVFGNPVALYIGRISYGIYLWHLPLAWLLWRHHLLGVSQLGGLRHDSIDFVAVALVTGAVASLSWFAYERPINQLKRFFPYAPSRRSPPAISGPVVLAPPSTGLNAPEGVAGR